MSKRLSVCGAPIPVHNSELSNQSQSKSERGADNQMVARCYDSYGRLTIFWPSCSIKFSQQAKPREKTPRAHPRKVGPL